MNCHIYELIIIICIAMNQHLEVICSNLSEAILRRDKRNFKSLLILFLENKTQPIPLSTLRYILKILSNLANNSEFNYILGRETYKKFAVNHLMIIFVIELYMAGLINDINCRDYQMNVARNLKKLQKINICLASVLEEMADMMCNFPELHCEFVLSQFCTFPCQRTLCALKTVSKQLKNIKRPSEDPNNFFHLDPVKYGFEQILCDDLMIILINTRNKEIHWNMNTVALFERCQMYMHKYSLKRQIKKHLKYLHTSKTDCNLNNIWVKNVTVSKVVESGTKNGDNNSIVDQF